MDNNNNLYVHINYIIYDLGNNVLGILYMRNICFKPSRNGRYSYMK